jgi:hypothetical protein
MTDRELERLHLLATLKQYAPQSASFIRERANDEAAHDAFDPIPPITPGGIAPKLVGLRSAGLAAYFAGDEHWDITLEGARVLEAGLNELDGVVVAPSPVTDRMVNIAVREFASQWNGANATHCMRLALTAALGREDE